MKREQDHPAVHLVNHIGIPKAFIAAVHIGESITEFDLRGKDKIREEKLEANTTLQSIIALVHLYDVV